MRNRQSSGIESRRLFGLRSRHVEWDGAAARHTPGIREVLVVGRDGVVITHSQYHVDQERFLFELRPHGIAG
ncbi:MAG TPA: hypothetical protein VE621_13040 [Bryobacteraceae bacterium]|nr:hypothetical protein [Bryobacteraceae bacterium]